MCRPTAGYGDTPSPTNAPVITTPESGEEIVESNGVCRHFRTTRVVEGIALLLMGLVAHHVMLVAGISYVV